MSQKARCDGFSLNLSHLHLILLNPNRYSLILKLQNNENFLSMLLHRYLRDHHFLQFSQPGSFIRIDRIHQPQKR